MYKEKGRTINSILNIFTTSFGSIVSLITAFVTRVVFLHFLNATYLGVSGLFSNILLIFSLVELGFGAALTQMFYKPFAEKDYRHLSQVTRTAKTILNLIGIIIIVLTLVFTPMLNLFVNDINAVPHMRLIFFLYGLSSAITYFLGYYRTIITANQQAHRLVKIDVGWKIVTTVSLTVVLAVFRNFILYLVAQIVLNFLQNVLVKRYVKKAIPEIDYNCKEFVPKKELKELRKNVMGLSMNRLATVVTNGTDNIIISKCLDLLTVGLASNYVMIQQYVISLIEPFFGPLLASIGNMCVSESDETKYDFFKKLYFAAFWLYGFCSITTYVLASPFIGFVFGNDYLIPSAAVLWLSVYIFMLGMYRVASIFRTAEGLFWHGKLRPLIQALLNLVISLILVTITGELWAVYAGTVFSVILITIWYEPYVVLKHGLHQGYAEFYKKLLYYVFCYVLCFILVDMISSNIKSTGLLLIIELAVLCIIVINVCFILLTFRMKEFRYWLAFVRNILKKIKKTH